MTEYRLVPVEPTPEMLEAARPWPTHWGDRALASNEQKAAYLADHMTVASDYRAMLSAAPPAPAREEVARMIPISPRAAGMTYFIGYKIQVTE